MRPGRPAFEPTAQQRLLVTQLTACGARQEVIAKHFGIDRKTLRRAFKKELDSGRQDANALVARSLFISAINGNTTAQIFWLKTRGGWREVTHLEHTGPDGQPLAGGPPPVMFGISFEDGGPGLPRVGGDTDKSGVFVTPPIIDAAEGVDVAAEVAVDVILHEPAALDAPRRPAEPRRMAKSISAAAEWEALGGEGSDT